MSSQAAADASEILDIYKSVFMVSSFQFCVVGKLSAHYTCRSRSCSSNDAAAFLLYDYLITLEQEIQLFWKRKFTGASALFFFTRYSTLLAYDVLGTATLSPLSDTGIKCSWVRCFADCSDTSCARLTNVQYAFTTFQYIPWAAFSALRVLALSGMRWSIALLVFVLSLAPAGAGFVVYGFHLTGSNLLTTGCQGESNVSQRQNVILVTVSRCGLILADIIVLLVTVVSTWKRGTPHLQGTAKRTLGDVLLYDGVIYFGYADSPISSVRTTRLTPRTLTLAAGTAQITTPYHSASYITVLSDPLTAVLVYRFLLDLQAANLASIGAGSSAPPSLPTMSNADANGTLVFASRVIGPLGGSLVATSEEDDISDWHSEGVPEDVSEGMAGRDDPASSAPVLTPVDEHNRDSVESNELSNERQ
ncbi:hypothetical protein BV20DRAFT_983129 [Pilatotrama ljubarskyi]|nr:hypothetical protein BV20DRAFT_983129 [Pilatotrama ljubarskyi]